MPLKSGGAFVGEPATGLSGEAGDAAARRDALIANVAAQIRRLRLTTPALFFLEANKPFSFLLGQLLYVGGPMLSLFWGENRSQEVGDILEDRDSLERLLRALES